ncbi:hypothetical protein [Paenibacillus terrigena]|uniref:hypothetical protein n=1 Tax=Paenibacillus terrigena TaxID=369333 RepID=UPI000373DA0A|nr:hypothetical protein [Paenibacillus terrigena]
MLSFEEKLAIADSFPELERKNVSMKRVNYHYEESMFDKKTVVYHLHPNGNGFVYAGYLTGYDVDDRGMVNIRDMSAEEIRTIIEASIRSLTWKGVRRATGSVEASDATTPDTAQEVIEERWTNAKNQSLELKLEDEDQMWYIFAGEDLDTVFESYEEAAEYLTEEGFVRAAD